MKKYTLSPDTFTLNFNVLFQVLNLSGCRLLSGPVPSSLGYCEALSCLDLSGCVSLLGVSGARSSGNWGKRGTSKRGGDRRKPGKTFPFGVSANDAEENGGERVGGSGGVQGKGGRGRGRGLGPVLETGGAAVKTTERKRQGGGMLPLTLGLCSDLCGTVGVSGTLLRYDHSRSTAFRQAWQELRSFLLSLLADRRRGAGRGGALGAGGGGGGEEERRRTVRSRSLSSLSRSLVKIHRSARGASRDVSQSASHRAKSRGVPSDALCGEIKDASKDASKVESKAESRGGGSSSDDLLVAAPGSAANSGGEGEDGGKYESGGGGGGRGGGGNVQHGEDGGLGGEAGAHRWVVGGTRGKPATLGITSKQRFYNEAHLITLVWQYLAGAGGPCQQYQPHDRIFTSQRRIAADDNAGGGDGAGDGAGAGDRDGDGGGEGEGDEDVDGDGAGGPGSGVGKRGGTGRLIPWGWCMPTPTPTPTPTDSPTGPCDSFVERVASAEQAALDRAAAMRERYAAKRGGARGGISRGVSRGGSTRRRPEEILNLVI